jgi:hypothetical protein
MYIMHIFHIDAIQVYIFAIFKQRSFCPRQFNKQYFVTFIKLGSLQLISEIYIATALTECGVIIIIKIDVKVLVVTRDTGEDG